VAKDYDPKQLIRAELDRLRHEFDGGEPLAVIEAYVRCYETRTALPRWVATALAERLRDELNAIGTRRAASGKRITAPGERRAARLRNELVRWFTMDWFRRNGLNRTEAKWAAAEFCRCSGSKVNDAYINFQQKYGMSTRPEPVPRGAEEMTPADLIVRDSDRDDDAELSRLLKSAKTTPHD
jgi:hypothetical protein